MRATVSLSPPAVLVRALLQERGALAAPFRVDVHTVSAALSSRLATLGAVLARAATDRRRLGVSLGDWAPAVAMLAGGGAAHGVVARALVQDIYEKLGVVPNWTAVDRAAPAALSSSFQIDYPFAVAVPSPNFWIERRPKKNPVLYVVIHDTESSCASALAWLINPIANASAHFLVCRDGRVYQLVNVKDAAWHAGNVYINLHSIGIEHEGYAGQGFTEAQYQATAALLRYVDDHDHLNLRWSRNTVFGHENVPAATHTDPGIGWDWAHFMTLLNGVPYTGGNPRIALTLWPRSYVHSCASVGCTIISTTNWGEQFHVFARKPGWVGIDFDGQQGWVVAPSVGTGSGSLVTVTTARTAVRAAPSDKGDFLVYLAKGETYISTVLDHTLTKGGWWLVPYAHHYGFVCSCAVAVDPGIKTSAVAPSPTVVLTSLSSATPTPSVIPTGTVTVTAGATSTSLPTVTPTLSPTTSPTPSPSPTLTPTASPTLTPSPTPSPALTPTLVSTPTGTPGTAPAPPTPLPTDQACANIC